MPSLKGLPCWQIMNCNAECKCKTDGNRERDCWEVAKEHEDYRTGFDVCADCIVFMVKKGTITLSAHEINEVRTAVHSTCVLLESNS